MNVDKTICKPIGSLIGIELDSLENIGIIWTSAYKTIVTTNWNYVDKFIQKHNNNYFKVLQL